ncbi:MAG: DUF3052 family protein [Pyrinomonadaceae bacterium]
MTTGYSGTPLAKKLGIKEGMTVVAVDAPEDYAELVDPLPVNASISHLEAASMQKPARSKGEIDIIHIFTNTRDGLFGGLAEAKKLIKQNGVIWVSWYKKAARLPTEITEDTIREAAFPLGLVDVKVCAVDEKWSGLKLVIRRENRQ